MVHDLAAQDKIEGLSFHFIAQGEVREYGREGLGITRGREN